MKRILFSMMTLLAMAGTSMAQTNALTVTDVELPQNAEATLTVCFQLDAANTYTAYTFNLELPAELEFVMDEGTDVACVKGSCHDESHFVKANLKDGLVKVLGLSVASKPLIGTSGVLLTFTIRPTDTFDVGTQFTGTIKDITIVDVEEAKQSLADAVFTVTIGEPDDGRIKFDENSASLPAYTAGDKGNVSMRRTIKAGEWSTIVLPFTLTKTKAEAAFGEDVELYEFTGFETVYSDDEDVTPDAINIQLTEYTLGAKKSMTGGKPFVIKTSQDIESFEADDVTLAGTVTDVTKTDEYDTQGKMTGSLVRTSIPEDGLFVSGNKFWYSTGQTAVKGFRCWFELGSVLDKETDFSAPVFFVIGSNPTGIETIGNGQLPEGYYDLKGQRVEHPKKGLYIKNGKKVVIK